ncbi:MAG: hypothetical protein N2554_08510 [Fimbriimonadales bacterium]|nr:hypothetical protein [Fimbriimonadales bacterium]
MSALEIRSAGGVDDWRWLRWTNAEGDPLPLEPPGAGELTRLPASPFGIAYPAPIQGIGRVYLWADSLTARTSAIHVERELAQGYLKAASALVKHYARRGAPMEAVQTRLQHAQSHATNQRWLECLADSVLAAEQGIVSVARTRLQRMRGRTAFLWGIHAEHPAEAHTALQQLGYPANMIHIALQSPTPDWSEAIHKAQSARLAIAADIPNDDSPASFIENLRALMNRYRGQIRYWTLGSCRQMSAAPTSPPSPLSEICEAARAIDFGAVRLLRAEHSMDAQRSAYPFLEQCVEMGVPFEAVHLVWRWYDGTLYDLDQVLERYGELGKPIHLDLSLPPDGGYTVFTREEPRLWLEGACLIALSKPFVVALRLPLTATENSAGVLNPEKQPADYWDRVREIAVWNRALQE